MQQQNQPGKQNQEQQTTGTQQDNTNKENISLPRIDRPEGPFEHSGEVAGWTKEEKEEKQDQAQQEQ